MRTHYSRITHNPLTPFQLESTLLASFLLGFLFLIPDAFATTGSTLFTEELTAVEKLFTGGYMRLGLLTICGMVAVTGAIKQSGWMFGVGILAGVFAFLMKDWILATFSLVL